MRLLGTIIAALVLFAIAVFSIFLIFYLGYLIYGADKEIKIAALTFIGTVIGFSTTQYLTKRREIDSRHFAAKAEACNKIVDLVWSMMLESKTGNKLSDDELQNALLECKRLVFLWGSPKLIRAFKGISTPGNGMAALFVKYDEFFRTLRYELGHADSDLKSLELTKFLLTDEAEKELDNAVADAKK
jgi:hypothetical protein